jgi:DNA-binding transcriptional ArsR family regulator
MISLGLSANSSRVDSERLRVGAVAKIAALIGDPGRLCMLAALSESGVLTASELAAKAGVTPQTASGHLAKLQAASLVVMAQRGRHRHFEIPNQEIVDLLWTINGVAGRLKEDRRHGHCAADGDARICGDHVAGGLGARLTASILPSTLGSMRPRPGVASRLAEWGVDLPNLSRDRRVVCQLCEESLRDTPHLGGALGAAIMARSLSLGWLRPLPGTRMLAVTSDGRVGFSSVFELADGEVLP